MGIDVDQDKLIRNPLLDFSIDFNKDRDPNCLLQSSVENMLQDGINIQGHEAITRTQIRITSRNKKMTYVL